MEFRVLGPLEALDEGRSIALGGAKQRSLLALLLFARGRPVASERLIDAIWGERAPETAQKSVQVYVSGLRKALGEGRILTRERGYAFVLEPGELDLDRFDLLVRQAAAEPAEHAAETLRSALALFRGQPLDDLALERWAEPEIARIEELRLLALEKRLDADLEVGRHRDVAPELETLVADHPYREHLLEQLMLALYRSGRQADALESYRRGAARLRDVLGLEPGRALQELEQRILRHDTSLDPLPAGRATTSTSARRRHGWRFVAVGGAIVLVAAVAAAAVALTRTTQASLTDLAPGFATLDARTGRLLSSIPTSEISQPVEAVVGSGSFWVWGLSPFSLTRINPENGKILIRIASPFGSDAGWYLPDGNSVWFVGNHDLVRVDAHTGLETNRYRLVTPTHTFGLVGIARGDGSLWLASNEENQLLRVDPAPGRILHTISIPSPWAVAYGDSAVWVTSNVVGLVRVDPATNTISATTAIPQPVNNVAVGGGFAWATNETKGTVYKVNQKGTIGATYQTGDGARGVSFADGKLWVVNQDVGSVTAIDPATGAERGFRFGHPLNAVAALGTRLAVVINPGRTYEDRITALKGKVARLIVPIYQFDPPDPPLAYNPFVFQAEQATCASLLRYPDAAPPEGFRLEPELATAMPTVSPDGRTYTFRIRNGYRFAPPSNAPVTAATIRYGIERALSPRLNDDLPGAQYLFDLNGVAKFRAGETTHIAGIHTNGNQIALTLIAPSPDFLERLSLPFFCPVPLDTPIVHAGLPDLAPPSAGPYTMDQRFNGEYMILTRNPNYQGPRPHAGGSSRCPCPPGSGGPR